MDNVSPGLFPIDTAGQARAWLRRASAMEALCRAMDIATLISGLWLLMACAASRPLWGLIPFGACLLITAAATRKRRLCMARAHRETLQVQIDNPHLDDGCGC